MSDSMVRATAAGGEILAFAACTADLVEEARQRHGMTPVVSAALGRTLTAAAMMGWQMKGEKDLLTIQIEGSGPIGGLVAIADSKGNVKGYANNPQVDLPLNSKGKLDVATAVGIGVMSVIRDIGLKEPYTGQTHSGGLGLLFYCLGTSSLRGFAGRAGQSGSNHMDSWRIYIADDAWSEGRDCATASGEGFGVYAGNRVSRRRPYSCRITA